jgi:flagellar protein FliS
MTQAHVNPGMEYLRTKVLTASPEQLQLMLFDGAVRFARQGRDALADGRLEASCDRLLRSQKIVLELTASLKPDVAPQLVDQLRGLYSYIYRRLVEANTRHDLQAADEAIDLLDYQRQTWQMLMTRLHPDRDAQPAARPAAEADGHARAAQAAGAASAHVSLNIAG